MRRLRGVNEAGIGVQVGFRQRVAAFLLQLASAIYRFDSLVRCAQIFWLGGGRKLKCPSVLIIMLLWKFMYSNLVRPVEADSGAHSLSVPGRYLRKMYAATMTVISKRLDMLPTFPFSLLQHPSLTTKAADTIDFPPHPFTPFSRKPPESQTTTFYSTAP